MWNMSDPTPEKRGIAGVLRFERTVQGDGAVSEKPRDREAGFRCTDSRGVWVWRCVEGGEGGKWGGGVLVRRTLLTLVRALSSAWVWGLGSRV